MHHLRAKIEINNINPYVLVSSGLASKIKQGWRKPMPVCIRVNGKPEVPWRINMMPVGDGSFYLYLHGHVRKSSGTVVGDTVNVEIMFDEEYKSGPAHPVPPLFEEALVQAPHVQRAWNNLTPSLQKEILRYFAGLKSPEAQQRHLEKALHVLGGGEGRFMARSWSKGCVVKSVLK